MAERDTSGKEPESGQSRLPRGRHGLPPEVVAENQRERLVAGIIAAVAEHGYGETTIAAIVKAAGLSRKTFYEHFANKEDCFRAAYEASLTYLRSGIATTEPEKDWKRSVRLRLEAMLELLAAEPDLASFFLIASTSVDDEIAGRHHEAMRELVGELTEGAPNAKGANESSGTREQAIAGGISRVVIGKLTAGEAGQLPGLLPDLVELVLRPYVGNEKAVRVARDD